jgi:hypothetical protein
MIYEIIKCLLINKYNLHSQLKTVCIKCVNVKKNYMSFLSNLSYLSFLSNLSNLSFLSNLSCLSNLSDLSCLSDLSNLSDLS